MITTQSLWHSPAFQKVRDPVTRELRNHFDGELACKTTLSSRTMACLRTALALCTQKGSDPLSIVRHVRASHLMRCWTHSFRAKMGTILIFTLLAQNLFFQPNGTLQTFPFHWSQRKPQCMQMYFCFYHIFHNKHEIKSFQADFPIFTGFPFAFDQNRCPLCHLCKLAFLGT